MSTERQRRADVIRLIVTTRERFPHTPAITEAMRRVIWRYALPIKSKPRRKAKATSNKS